MELPILKDYRINKFAGGTVTELESGITNGVIEKSGDHVYVIQRPGIDIRNDASSDITDGRGRAIYHWEQSDHTYMFHDGTIYRDDYGTTLSTSPTAGTRKCKFVENENVLVLLDPANGEGWQIEDDDTVTEITDVNFPPAQTPAVNLAQGGAYLDGYLFVLGENGTIYNSNLDDVLTWGALAFITAERDPDVGQYIGKHHEHIVAMGTSTIEFFYNNANSTGSPLSRRQDIMHNVGCVDGDSVFESGDIIMFVGSDSSGSIGIYKLEQFSITKVSNSTIDSFLTQALVKDGISVIGSGFNAQGHSYYVITLHTVETDISPITTLCYDLTTNVWSDWNTTIGGLTSFPIMDWSRRVGTGFQFGQGIMVNGDVVSVNDNIIPLDTLGGDGYVVGGYVAVDYVETAGGIGTNIPITVRLGLFGGGTNHHKYCSYMKPLMNDTINSNTITVRWSNENSASFTSTQDIDTSLNGRVFRGGRFRKRNHELFYQGDEQIRLSGLELGLKRGTN